MTLLYDLALTLLPRVGSKKAYQLIEVFGSAERIFNSPPSELIAAGMTAAAVDMIQKNAHYALAEHIVEICAAKGVRIVVRGTPNYPDMLAQCPDAPHVLYIHGDLDFNKGRWVSIVGTRKATVAGTNYVNEIVHSLSAAFSDLVVVSGLAFGIDKAAHTAAMEYNIPTVAVMAGWVEDIVPPSHHYVARQILAKGGAIVSDMPPGTVIRGGNFLSRNRIIAGLAHATIVAESGTKGGSLVTADIASSYNRPVFAVPGRSEDENFAGTNALIKSQRAILYQDTSDLAVELGWQRETMNREVNSSLQANALSGTMLALFTAIPDTEPVTLEEMAERCDVPLHTASSILMALETRGLIKSLQGRLFQKAKY